MTSALRRRRHTYIGAPWPRGFSQAATKMEHTKQSKKKNDTYHSILPLVIKPNGRWALKFGKMYLAKRS